MLYHFLLNGAWMLLSKGFGRGAGRGERLEPLLFLDASDATSVLPSHEPMSRLCVDRAAGSEPCAAHHQNVRKDTVIERFIRAKSRRICRDCGMIGRDILRAG